MTPVVDIYVILSVFALGLGIFFLLYLATNRRYYTLPNLILASIIFAVCFEIWNDVLIQSKYIYEFPWFFKLGGKFKLFIFSSLLIYTLLITNDKPAYQPHLLLIYIPYIVDFFVWQRGFLWFSIDQKLEMIDMFYADTRPGPMNIWKMPWVIVVSFVVPGIYLAYALYKLNQYRKRTEVVIKTSFKVFTVLIYGCLLYVLLGNTVTNIVYIINGQSFIDWTLDLLLMSIISLMIAFFIMKQLEITKAPEASADLEKYRNSNLTAGQLESILERIRQVMEKEKLYLNPELSLVGLSQSMEVNSAYLSQSVNKGLNLRFTDFVNQYRVEASKLLLSDAEHDKYTIEAIANQSGFRSKSAFYRAFQKETGISPADFKKQRREPG